MKPDHLMSVGRIAKEHGLEAAEEISAFEASHVEVINNLIKTEGIDCDFVMTECMDVQMNSDRANAVHEMFNDIQKRGGKCVDNVSLSGGANARKVI